MGRFKTGDVVMATAGKEKGSVFVVIEDFRADQLLIADGRHRKIESPKKKSAKHLLLLGHLEELVLNNRLIWKSLSPYRG